MTRSGIAISLFGAAFICGLVFVAVCDATVVPLVSRGSGQAGVQVTTHGWLAFAISLLGTGGFTLAGFVTALANRLGLSVISPDARDMIAEILELTAAFRSLMHDKSNRAAQRRFFFALVDAAGLIQGCETSHESGVVVIKYCGYADQVSSSIKGLK